jgi:hypothetical protein
MSDPLATGARIRDLRNELRQLERQNEQEMARIQPLSLEEEHRMMAMQARADEVYRGAGRYAPAPEAHERASAYERRLTDGLKVYSERWSKANFSAMPDDAFAIVRDQVLADASQTARTHGLRADEIRELPSSSNAGHRVIEFTGGDRAWFGNQFRRPARRAMFLAPEEYLRQAQAATMSQIAHAYQYRAPMQAPRSAF